MTANGALQGLAAAATLSICSVVTLLFARSTLTKELLLTERAGHLNNVGDETCTGKLFPVSYACCGKFAF